MKLGRLLLIILLVNITSYSQTYTPPTESESLFSKDFFKNAKPLDEQYRKQFDDCDSRNYFNGINMALYKYKSCSDDQNKLKALLKFPDGTIFFDSKMGLDVDGSWKACCEKPGLTDQCSTSYSFKGEKKNETACESYKRGLYVDADVYPYIVIPTTVPNKTFPNQNQAKEFRNKTKTKIGDVGVVIYKNKMIPIFVADGGPHNKIGEGSAALFRELGETWCREFDGENHCIKYRRDSIGDSVLFFIFPSSEISGFKNKTVQQRLESIKKTAETKFKELSNPKLPKIAKIIKKRKTLKPKLIK